MEKITTIAAVLVACGSLGFSVMNLVSSADLRNNALENLIQVCGMVGGVIEVEGLFKDINCNTDNLYE